MSTTTVSSASTDKTSGTGTRIQSVSVPVRLADGTKVILRPIARSDSENIRTGLLSMSPESRYHRFFTCAPGLSKAQLRYLTEVDQVNHVAWVAIAAEPTAAAGLGVARFVRMPDQPAIAEFSFAVIDAMQRKGLGRLFLALLHILAAERGVGILRGTCLPENDAVVSWLCGLGAEYRGYAEGTIDLDLHVGRSPERSAPSGSSAERFARALDHLGRALAGARECCAHPERRCPTPANKNHRRARRWDSDPKFPI